MSIDIAAENALSGEPSPTSWTLSGHGSSSNYGFARSASVNVGETVEFSCHGDGVVIDIYRVGYYDGQTVRKVVTVTNTATTQPEAEVIPDSEGATTCTSWSVTASWEVPGDATSGLYFGLYRNAAESDGFYLPFIVRDDNAEADIIYKTSDATWWAAYNHFGTQSDFDGKNIYGDGVGVGAIQSRSLCVDYHRPVITRGTVPQTYWMACELPLIRFLERNGFRVKYVTCVDLDETPDLLDSGKVFISSGHDEYWSLNMRRNVENWRNTKAGRSLFMTGNEVFWKTEHERSGDRVTMWCRKDTMPGPIGTGHVAGQPFVAGEWQGTWKDTRWPGAEGEWLLTGTDFRMNGIYDYDAPIPMNPYGGHPVWGNSALNDGNITVTRVVGFEADSMRPTMPEQSVRVLAAYTRNINGAYADDNGQNYSGNGDLEWGIISQRYPGGGVTVGFGTCQWSWALDSRHDRGTGTEVSADAQQFTVNLLTDLGATAHTLMSGLAARSPASLDNYGFDPTMIPGEDSNADLEVWDGTSWVPVILEGVGQEGELLNVLIAYP